MSKTQKLLFTLTYISIIVFVIIISTVPPVSRDAQTHHLALPKIWLSDGILSVVPEMEFSYYPQLINLLYIIPIALDHDIAAKYIHFSFALATALLIFLFIRRYIGNFWGLMGGLMFLTLPIILKLSVTVYVDLGLLFFFTASLFSVIIWLEKPENLRWLIMAGISSGLALSTKYNAILAVTILTLIFGFFYFKLYRNSNNAQVQYLKYLTIFSFLAIMIFSPWAIRNIKLTGNPVYPMYDSIFSKFNDDKQFGQETLNLPKQETIKPFTYRYLVYQESPIYTLALPIRVFFEGQDDNPQHFDGKLNPMLLLFSLLLLVKIKSNWRHKFLASFVVITLVYTMFATDMRIRYIITIVPPMIVLSIFGLQHISNWLKHKTSPLIIKTLTTLFLFSYFFFNVTYATNLYNKIDPIPYLTGEITREAYISNHLPYYSLNQLANQVVPKNGKLLGVYTGNRRYYLDVPHTLESELLLYLSKKVSNANGLSQELTKKQITHILVRMDLFNNRMREEKKEAQDLIIVFFKQNMKLLASKDRFALYKVIDLTPLNQ